MAKPAPVKIVVNACYGGFSLSPAAGRWLAAHGCPLAIQLMAEYDAETDPGMLHIQKTSVYGFRDLARHDPRLIACVEALGPAANGGHAQLEIETLKGRRYRIEEYDGLESVREPCDDDWIEVP